MNQHFASFRQRDTRLATPEHQLFLGAYDKSLAIGLNFDLSRLLRPGPALSTLHAADDDGTTRVCFLEYKDDLPANVLAVHVLGGTRRQGSTSHLPWKYHKRRSSVVPESNQNADNCALDSRRASRRRYPCVQVCGLVSEVISTGLDFPGLGVHPKFLRLTHAPAPSVRIDLAALHRNIAVGFDVDIATAVD
jgi:hypothetical protein